MMIADTVEQLKDKYRVCQATKHGKAIHKHQANAKLIEQVQDAVSERLNPTCKSVGFGGCVVEVAVVAAESARERVMYQKKLSAATVCAEVTRLPRV